MEVRPFLTAKEKFGGSLQGDYIFRYLNDLNAKTVVIEDNYIDKDYLIDYSNFYSRSFNDPSKYTTRLHFFKNKFTEKTFKEKFHSSKRFQKSINKNYLGFVVIKPITNRGKTQFIGRTLLQTYPIDADNDDTRYFIGYTHHISLYGVRLTIQSLPYQMQDRSVAACATTSIWVSLFALNHLFGVPKQSPFEITKTSVSFPGIGRNFPSGGLNIWQIKEYFNSIGLETEIIDVENIDKQNNNLIILDIIKAYLNCRLPIIAIIHLIKNNPNNPDLHSVIVSGYRSDRSGKITELYLHDDGIGPYCRTKSKNGDISFSYWENEWIGTKENQYTNLKVETLLIPIYPKIRHSFIEIDKLYLDVKKRYNIKGYVTKLILEELNQYKEYLLNKSFHKKIEILINQFPKYVWIIRVEKNKLPVIDYVFDATSVFREKLYTIQYIN